MKRCFCWLACGLMGFVVATNAASPIPAEARKLFKAMEDELARSMSLQLEDLEKPYFIQYAVDDTRVDRLSASYGSLIQSGPLRARSLHTVVRVGSMALDNSNFAGRGAFGRRGSAELPLDDDYAAMRQAIWRATDGLYKGAVETLTQKKAYLKDHPKEDRPVDFTAVPATTNFGEAVHISFDRAKWEDYARRVSESFSAYQHIDDSEVRLVAGVENRYVVNSEGARLAYGESEVSLRISAEALAADGEHISDELDYFARTPTGLPSIEKVLADVKSLAERLSRSVAAPILEDYTGPVLMEGSAAPLVFRQLLSRGVATLPEVVGAPRRSSGGTDDWEKRLGKRVLPTTFRVYDDPRVKEVRGVPLAGHFDIDDEGVAAQRVDLVVGGKLHDMLVSRVPTKRFNKSNGHGRRGGGEAPHAALGNLFIESSEPKNPAALRKALIKAADDEGLPYGLRIEGLQGRDADMAARLRRAGGSRSVGDPVRIYKVFVSDGHEELVRGCEFRFFDERNLRRILAAGDVPIVSNQVIGSSPSSAVIAPAVLFEELELTKIERESERKPYLPAPQARAARK